MHLNHSMYNIVGTNPLNTRMFSLYIYIWCELIYTKLVKINDPTTAFCA